MKLLRLLTAWLSWLFFSAAFCDVVVQAILISNVLMGRQQLTSVYSSPLEIVGHGVGIATCFCLWNVLITWSENVSKDQVR